MVAPVSQISFMPVILYMQNESGGWDKIAELKPFVWRPQIAWLKMMHRSTGQHWRRTARKNVKAFRKQK